MSLTCGSSSNFPCPICLVPSSKQHCLLEKFDFQTQAATKALVHQALTKDATTCETMLKNQGLRPVIVSIINFSIFFLIFFPECILESTPI
jgi:hypothetical protein